MARTRALAFFWSATLLAGLAFSAPACRNGALSWRLRKRPLLVLISVDTLRADRLPAYGFNGVETPAIDALRRDGILYTRAFSHVPLTLPSHLSMFTGLLPFDHGVRDNAGYELPASVPTLAGELKAAGYATGGAVSAFVLARMSGVARGFDAFDDRLEPATPHAGTGEIQRQGAATEAVLEEWISGIGDRPFFAFLHLYEPHSPYDPPEPFRSRYAGTPYLGEIAAADAVVGRFVAFLKGRGLYDRSLIVFLSDHGEGLGQHGEAEHGIFLYREDLHVPLLVKRPSGKDAGATCDEAVGLADVFPTLLSAAGRTPPSRPNAADLMALFDAGKPAGRRIFAETLYPRLHLGWSDLASLTDGRWHYIKAPSPEIYDMAADPDEVRDLARSTPDALRTLRVAMDGYQRSFQKPSVQDAERRARLASLGYLSAAPDASGPLPDPKDRIAGYARIQQAIQLTNAGRDAEALPELKRLLGENPTLFDLWYSYALSLSRVGRLDEAIETAKTGIRRAPSDSPVLAHLLAELYLKKGDTAEALRHAELARDMGESRAEFFLPEIYLARGDLAKAKEAAHVAIAKSSYPTLPRLILARILQAEGDYQGALAEVDRAGEALASSRGRPLAGMSLYRGELLLALGRTPEAIAAIAEECRRSPENLDAALELARACALGGQTAEARSVAARLADAKPKSPEVLQRSVIALEAGGDAEGGEALRRRGRRAFPGDVRFAPAARARPQAESSR